LKDCNSKERLMAMVVHAVALADVNLAVVAE
jgi:hypothetical protein